jgi:hypothetical protein
MPERERAWPRSSREQRSRENPDTEGRAMSNCVILSVLLAGASICPGSGYLGSCPADVNGDGTVGVGDFLELLAEWGFNPCSHADLTGDRSVDILDFFAYLAQFGPCPPTVIEPIHGCRALDQEGTTYVLQEDLPSLTTNCFTITADRVVLDGNGHTITGDDGIGDYAVEATGRWGLVIRNLNIVYFGRGVNLIDTDDSLIEANNSCRSSVRP